jgi:hypothetical protein
MKKTMMCVAICLAIGCKNANDNRPSIRSSDMKEVASKALPPAESADKAAAPTSDLVSNLTQSKEISDASVKRVIVPTSVYSTPFRKIIRTAQVKSKVENTEQATYKIEQIARKFNGFVTETYLESRNLEQNETPISNDSTLEITKFEVANTIALRVPNARLDSFLIELSTIYTHLDYRRMNAQDVTATFLTNQLKAQLRDNSAKRIAEASDEKGKRLNDIVGAEESRVNLKDAAIEQQIENLETDYNIDFSVVNLEIYQNALVSKTMKANNGNLNASANFGYRFTNALSNGWSILLEVFLFFVNLWAFILFGCAAFWAYRHFKVARFLSAKA